jgi:broad specificity polyphosphatase/5'/3'-nucleotidase SurE
MQHDQLQETVNTGDDKIYSGPIIAATLAPVLGFYTLAITHHISRLTPGLEKQIGRAHV